MKVEPAGKPRWSVEAAGWSECGPRERNEDAYAVDAERLVFVIADGMGGHAYGKRASEEAVHTVLRHLAGAPDPAAALADAVLAAHAAVSVHGDNRGTTLTVAAVEGKSLHVAHVGDTRLYLNGRMMTHDQGVGHALQEFVGGFRAPRVQRHLQVLPADAWLLLTTDGVHDVIRVPEAFRHLVRNGTQDARAMARSLAQMALYNGSTDNCTVLAVHLVAGGLPLHRMTPQGASVGSDGRGRADGHRAET